MAETKDWPDQWIGDLEDGKAKAREAEPVQGCVNMEPLKSALKVAIGIWGSTEGNRLTILSTEAVIRADRLAVIERCEAELKKQFIAFGAYTFGGIWEPVKAALEKLKEGI